MKKIMIKISQLSLLLFAIILLFSACTKEDEVFDNPYAGGKEKLGIVFNNANIPVPADGAPGAEIVFQASGVESYKNTLIFNFNGQPAEVVSVTATEIKVRVPEAASTGATSIVIGDQVFFGPQFKVNGKISADPYFKPLNGANGSVNDYLRLKDGRLILVGAFNNYDNKGIVVPNNRIVLTSKEGEIDRSFRFGSGANGTLTSIVATANDANFFVGGSFFQFDKLNRFVNNITRLLPTGAIDSTTTLTYSNKRIGIPSFNGGTNGGISKLFMYQNKIIAVGNFTHYVTRRYNQGRTFVDINGITVLKDSIITDSVISRQVLRFNIDGSLDKTYHFNTAENKSYSGGNGAITDAVMQPDGKLILVGTFSRFDDANAGHIVRLTTNGTVDQTFNVGAGANSNISSITYNEINNKYLIAGIFGSFNGLSVQGIVQMNDNGTVDNSFLAKDFDNGFPSFAKQLSNGLIIVNGSFRKYNGVKRPGFIVLNASGNLAPGYNSTGDFQGNINKIFETKNQDNKTAIMLMGNLAKFDAKLIYNITGLALEN